jgi:glycosyltransferase involved in cell wall biosynthesis
MNRELITVVVCTFNRARLLDRALGSLERLHTKGVFDYEVLVVDNGSEDDTRAVVEAHTIRSTTRMRYVLETAPGVSHARNRGLKEAHGKWIAFFDDDQWADPNWLYELIHFAKRTRATVVGGAVRLLLDDRALARLALVCREYLGESVGRNREEKCARNTYPGTGNMLVARSVISLIGKFDVAMQTGGEDAELGARIRAARIPAWYCPSAVVYHEVPEYRTTRQYLLWVAQRYGDCFATRDHSEWGPYRTLCIAGARLIQLVVVVFPALLFTAVLNKQSERLGFLCKACKAVAYARRALCLALPRLFPQHTYFSHLCFRDERRLFAAEAIAAAIAGSHPGQFFQKS